MEDDYYTVGQAARLLEVGEARVRQMLRKGQLEGERDEMLDRWRIPRAAVHALRDSRREASESPLRAPTTPAVDMLAVVRDLENQLGYMRARAELTERAESTLREDVERERKRADEERKRADEERERADRLEERAEQVRDELEAERSKGFWSRLFGA